MRQLQMQHKLNEIYTLRNIAIGYAIKEHSRWNGIVKKTGEQTCNLMAMQCLRSITTIPETNRLRKNGIVARGASEPGNI